MAHSLIGVDEVGRGSWAGPLLVVASRATGGLPSGLKDSKLMTRKQRESIFERLTSNVEFGEGWVTAAKIDEHGLAEAMRLGVAKALEKLNTQIDEEIILDGKVNYIPAKFKNTKCIVNADALIPLVSAAGIYAKVRRDEYMSKLKIPYPEYGFEKHAGYGTVTHRLAIVEHGILEGIHRTSFKPLQSLTGAKG